MLLILNSNNKILKNAQVLKMLLNSLQARKYINKTNAMEVYQLLFTKFTIHVKNYEILFGSNSF